MIYLVLAKKAYLRNLQYREMHAGRMIGSVIFGFIYMAIWSGVAEGRQLGTYDANEIVSYIAFNQVSLWVIFCTGCLGIDAAVRNGQISFDLMRPVHLFTFLLCREWGQIAYQSAFTSVPIYLIYLFAVPIRTPEHALTWAWTAAALILASYISICVTYLIGIMALWTTETGWVMSLHHALYTLFSGFLIPVEWLPSWLNAISRYSFYPTLHDYPTKLYLEMGNPSVLFVSLGWCVLLTCLCLTATNFFRRKLEVQGG